MSKPIWDFGSVPNTDLINRAHAQMETVARTIRMATVLTSHGRQVDLSGLEQQVGVLCAQTLDLGWQQARALRPRLAGLLGEIDQLASLQNLD